MNERILEIAKEADPSGWYYGIDPRVMDPEIKKFAELLIRKCSNIACNTDLEDVEGGDSAILRAASNQIVQYFGVK